MEAARESERLHSALLDSVTHDLRTPLTSIRAAATTLISQPQMSEPQRREMYAVVDEESARLDRLIGQAIEMAQLDSASIHVQAKPESVREIIELALEEAQPLLGERPVECRCTEEHAFGSLGSHARPPRIAASDRKCRQVFSSGLAACASPAESKTSASW